LISNLHNYNPLNLFKLSPLKCLEQVCFACALSLILIWPLPGTIAGRNFLLALGCFSSCLWLYRAKIKINWQLLFPIACLLSVPVWLWIHYLLFPVNIGAQIYDLKGTWLRVVLAIILGGSLGLMISRRPKMLFWIYTPVLLLALIVLGAYLIDFFHASQWVIQNIRFPFKYKSALVYFLMNLCLFSYAILHYCILDRRGADHRALVRLGLAGSLLAAICWVDFIIAHALNGVLIAGLTGLILLVIYLSSGAWFLNQKSYRYWVLLITVASILICSFSIFWNYDQKYENKLGNIFEDIQASSQIENHIEWRRDLAYQGPYTPNNASGIPINASTYERTAWFVKGAHILWENPLGTGFSHLAFRHYMLKENPNFGVYKTHSGWLDFALGVGLPGLLLTWCAMAYIFVKSIVILRSSPRISVLALTSVWVLGGLWILWWPTELSEREFIENLFFIIALLGCATIAENSILPTKSAE
jgi:hypothetical protein